MGASDLGAVPTKVCRHCSTVAETTSDRCPSCRKGYRHGRGWTVLLWIVAFVVTLMVLAFLAQRLIDPA